MATNVYDVIVIGAGLSGLACGAGLKTFGIQNFIILEKGDCCAYFWKSFTYDRMQLHTPWHDLPYDKGLVYTYSKYKTRLEVVSYLKKYAELHQLPSKIQFNSNVININKQKNKCLWQITYANHLKSSNEVITLSSKYLVVATSNFRSPSIPNTLAQSMGNFSGEIMHSAQYKNAAKYKNKSMLVVGNGNSACEVCIDAVEHGVDKIAMVSRGPRHFVPLKSFERGPFRMMIISKFLGLFDQIHSSKLFKVTKTHPKYRAQLDHNSKKWGYMSVDMSKYGFTKPKLPVLEETIEGNYQVMDVGFIPLVESGRIDIIKGGVEKFAGDDIYMENGEILPDKYDVVVLCTGFEHGLQKLFDQSIFMEYFYDGSKDNKCQLYPRFKVFPKTNGQNQALNDTSLYFANFDPSCVTSGLARGIWGWQIARQISKDEKKYDRSMELSHWNYMNSLVITGIGIVVVVVVGVIVAFF